MIGLILALATAALPVGGSWARLDDYPAVALQNGHEGAVGVEVTVDRTGVPADCRVFASSRWEELDDESCLLVRKRARFTPAVDDAGEPIAFVYRQRVVWALASTIPTAGPDADNELDVQLKAFPKDLTYPSAMLLFTVRADGKPQGCGVQPGSGSDALDRATCSALAASESFAPVTDEAGKPLRFLRLQKVGFAVEAARPAAPFTLAWQVNDGNRVFGCHAVTEGVDRAVEREACRQIATRYHWTQGSFTSVYPPPSILPSAH